MNKMDYKYIAEDESETIALAENLESEHFPGMVICLNGELGSGKTVFTKAFASALGIPDDVTSPTFNIIKEYSNGELPLYHMDVYRLEGNVNELGLDEYFDGDGVTIIEWADMIEDHLPKERLDINIRVTGEDSRVIVLKPHGKVYEDICEAIL
jgi:tRNA threonylcarbamoyladenosine biosynthesis protein TsaE